MKKLFAFYCRDGEHSAIFREHSHDALIEHFAEHGKDFAVAGPMVKGDKIVGSLLVIKAVDESDARAKLEAIPYFSVGVWQSIRVDEFQPLFGDWAASLAEEAKHG
ncbi:YciI family protein [Altererythrobacter sp. Z27]|uniref:YciI family protein n=1 Tax=Altererythrobacter sp. Z27 TaxID=3461147 RepID=UPI004044CBCE